MAADKKKVDDEKKKLDEMYKSQPFSGPTFLCPCNLPMRKEDWVKASYRERMRAWNAQATVLNAQFPVPTVVLVYAIFGVCWWMAYDKWAKDPSLPFFSEKNIKRFIIYNTLINALGFGATSGLLGFRFKIPFGCGLHFLTPGTLCAPLMPKVAEHVLQQKPAGVRSPQAVAAFVFLIATLVLALQKPEFPQLCSLYVALVLNLFFDFSVLQSCRLEHNVYFLVALGFPDWVNGCQVVQVGLWFWAGTAKIGPWWRYVIPFIAKDNALSWFMPNGLMQWFLVKDYPRDSAPSTLCSCAALVGSAMECIQGLSVCAPHGSWPHFFGVYGACCYHTFIGLCIPFASVQEWNYFTIIMNLYLYKEHAFALPTSPLLIAFLSIVSFAVPIWGQLQPNLVPFLTAYRPYMGNWRFTWYVVKNSAMHKHERLTTWCNPIIGEDGKWFYGNLPSSLGKQGVEMMEGIDFCLTAPLLGVPQYRPLVSVVEKLLKDNKWDLNDVTIVHSEGWQNQVFGWSLGTGWIATRECAREAIQYKCKFDEKEMYMINFEPASPIPWGSEPPYGQRVQWRCYDITKGPYNAQIHGNLPYSELIKRGGSGAAEMYLTDEEMKSGKSIKGTFGLFDVYH